MIKNKLKNGLTFSFCKGKVRALKNRQGALTMTNKQTYFANPNNNAHAAIILLIKP